MNENESVAYQIPQKHCSETNLQVKGIFSSLKSLKTTFYLKKLTNKQQTKLKSSRRKEIIKIRMKINEIQSRKMRKSIKPMFALCNDYKINKTLVR